MEIHLFDILKFGKLNIAVDINDSLKEKIKKEISNNISSIAEELNLEPTRIYEYFIWKRSNIPLIILYNLSKKFKISENEIERNTILIKQLYTPSKNSIKNPKLPIRITPYLTSLVANLFFDGSVPNDGKGTYYNQKNNEIMEDFIEKVKEIFGDVYYSCKTDHRGVLKCRIPRLIGELCRNIYNIKSFGTFDSRIPELIFKLNKEHKIAFILTGIIDEGSITYDGSIQFSISNRLMIEDFQRLCNEIGLKTTSIKSHKHTGHYYIYIKSIKVLNDFMKGFNKKYPLIALRYKQERLKKALIIKQQKFLYTKDFADKRKSILLLELKKKENTINFLSDKFLINPKTINRYFHRLMKENVLRREKRGNKYTYFLNTH